MPVCCVNADLVETSEGQLMCVCRNGYTGDGVTSCTGQFNVYILTKHNAVVIRNVKCHETRILMELVTLQTSMNASQTMMTVMNMPSVLIQKVALNATANLD